MIILNANYITYANNINNEYIQFIVKDSKGNSVLGKTVKAYFIMIWHYS